jgi:hypothetical protein
MLNKSQHQELIRRQILLALADCSGYLLAEPVLLNQLNCTVDPPLTLSEFSAHLAWLESNRFTIGIRPELGGPVKWKISDDGKALLAQ